MGTSRSRARWVRGALAGACSAIVTVIAHAVGGCASPSSPALVVAVLACASTGAALAGITLESRGHRVLGVIGALAIAQALGHGLLTVVGGHHHDLLGSSPAMVAAHVVAAVTLGVAIASVEYLYAVCTSVLCWLRLFLVHAQRPPARPPVATNDVVAQSVLRLSGLGMRAPPLLACTRG